MKILIDIPDDYYKKIKKIKVVHYTARIYEAVQKGIVLDDNIMVINKDKLECDTEWDFYADCYGSYSMGAIEAAEIEKENLKCQE